MQISSIALLSTTKAAKPGAASSAQSTATDRDASLMTIKIAELSSNSRSQGVPDISMNQLNSMVQTSLKMQSIRNDASIPEEVKKKLLAPLEQANKDTLNIVAARAEQDEKEKIIEASSEDAEAIRKAGEEIAASASEAESTEPVPLSSTDAAVSATKATVASSATQAAAPETSSTVSSASSIGTNVDIQV